MIAEVVLSLLAAVAAQVPEVQKPVSRQEFAQLVQQWQANPENRNLENRIIDVASTLRPLPAPPETAREPFIQGATLFREAKTPADLNLVISKFAAAVRIAPWWREARYNLALAYEAAKRFDDASAQLKIYMRLEPEAGDARDVQDKIYALGAQAAKAQVDRAETDWQQLQARLAAMALQHDQGGAWGCITGCDSNSVRITGDSVSGTISLSYSSTETGPRTYAVPLNLSIRGGAVTGTASYPAGQLGACAIPAVMQQVTGSLSEEGRRLDLHVTVPGWSGFQVQANRFVAPSCTDLKNNPVVINVSLVTARNQQSSILSWAAAWGSGSDLEMALAHGEDPNIRDSSGKTPLFWAVSSVNSATTRILLGKTQPGADGPAMLAAAACNSGSPADHAQITQMLLDAGVKPAGFQTLKCAIRAGRPDEVSLLLRAGADIAAQDSDGASALHWAGNAETGRLLISSGACLDCRDNKGQSPLHYAISNAAVPGQLDLARLLIQSGAPIDSLDRDNNDPIRLAVRNGNIEAVKLLVGYGARPWWGLSAGFIPHNLGAYKEAEKAPGLDLFRAITPVCAQIGVRTQWLDSDLGKRFGVASLQYRTIVSEIRKGSVAEKAGMGAGDIITHVDQTPVASPLDFVGAIRSHFGSEVSIRALHGGVSKDFAIKVGADRFCEVNGDGRTPFDRIEWNYSRYADRSIEGGTAIPPFGFQVQTFSSAIRKKLDLSGYGYDGGAIVTSIAPDSVLNRAGLAQCQVIFEVLSASNSWTPVKTAEDLKSQLEKAGGPVLMRVWTPWDGAAFYANVPAPGAPATPAQVHSVCPSGAEATPLSKKTEKNIKKY